MVEISPKIKPKDFSELLKKVSENFKANIQDFSASVKWIQDDIEQSGNLIFKNPLVGKTVFAVVVKGEPVSAIANNPSSSASAFVPKAIELKAMFPGLLS